MARLQKLREVDKDRCPVGWDHYWFWCPGCETNHKFSVWTGPGARPPAEPSWTITGDAATGATFTPSLLYGGPPRCHLFLRGGILEFLGDCDHALAGQNVPLPDIPEDD